MPVHGGVLGQSVGDEDANLVALDRLDGRARRLAVVAPEVRLHAVGDMAVQRLHLGVAAPHRQLLRLRCADGHGQRQLQQQGCGDGHDGDLCRAGDVRGTGHQRLLLGRRDSV